MLKLVMTITLFTFLCDQGVALNKDHENNPIVIFDIGGYVIKTRKLDVVQANSSYLSILLRAIPINTYPIFINCDQQSAALLDYWIHHQRLPETYDRNVALNVMNFFGIPEMASHIKPAKPKWSEIRFCKFIINTKYKEIFLQTWFCSECEALKHEYALSTLSEAILHFIKDHDAKIITGYEYKGLTLEERTIMYQVPLAQE